MRGCNWLYDHRCYKTLGMLDVSYLTFFVSETSALMNFLASLHLIWVRFCGCAAQGLPGSPRSCCSGHRQFCMGRGLCRRFAYCGWNLAHTDALFMCFVKDILPGRGMPLSAIGSLLREKVLCLNFDPIYLAPIRS